MNTGEGDQFMNSIARAATYEDMATRSIVLGATSHELISLLFEELDRSLKASEYFHDHQDSFHLRKNVTKASQILAGLLGSLDSEQGGEISENLALLYRFCITELLKANINTDRSIITSVRDLIAPIQQAWNDMPERYKVYEK